MGVSLLSFLKSKLNERSSIGDVAKDFLTPDGAEFWMGYELELDPKFKPQPVFTWLQMLEHAEMSYKRLEETTSDILSAYAKAWKAWVKFNHVGLKAEDAPGWVYFYKLKGKGLFKVGRSAGGPLARFAQVQYDAQGELVYFNAIKTPYYKVIEKEIHRHFKDRCVGPEWFELTNEEANSIIFNYCILDPEAQKVEKLSRVLVHKTWRASFWNEFLPYDLAQTLIKQGHSNLFRILYPFDTADAPTVINNKSRFNVA